MDTDRFIIYIKTKYVFEDISNDVEKRFDTSIDHWSLQIGKKKKLIGLMGNELGGKTATEFVELRPNTYSPPGIRSRSDVLFRSHIGQDVADNSETLS